MKIAIVGSAPSSKRLAPYGDPTWTIWGCSPNLAAINPRIDAWFELHRYVMHAPWLTPDYFLFLARQQAPVYMIEPVREVPRSVAFPRAESESVFGRYFFTSTPAWMMALAIMEKPQEIGIFGIDMAAHAEYADQRPGMHYFIQEAQKRDIKITVPPESDILQPPPPYGFCETDPLWIKAESKRVELEQRVAEERAVAAAAEKRATFLDGGLNVVNYTLRTWAGR